MIECTGELESLAYLVLCYFSHRSDFVALVLRLAKPAYWRQWFNLIMILNLIREHCIVHHLAACFICFEQ